MASIDFSPTNGSVRQSRLPRVGRQGGEPDILDGPTDGEVIEALPVARLDAKHLVNRIVEVAADSGRTDACLLRFEDRTWPTSPASQKRFR
jgi:hypothetical protein